MKIGDRSPIHPALWLTALAAVGYAAHIVARDATPIDQSLPLIAVVLAALSWLSGTPQVLAVTPMLLLAEMTLEEERGRLLTLGIIVSLTFAATLVQLSTNRGPDRRWYEPLAYWPAAGFAICSLAMLRWLPVSPAVWKEAILCGGLLILLTRPRSRTPVGLVTAILLVLVIPAIPLRLLFIPLLSTMTPGWFFIVPAALAVYVRPSLAVILGCWSLALGAPHLRPRLLQIPLFVLAGWVMCLFAWSGVVARGPCFFLRRTPEEVRIPSGITLAPGQAAELIRPLRATGVVVQGANISQLDRHTLLGSLDGRTLRIQDAADWGYMRSQHWYWSRNEVPLLPAGAITGYGIEAWAGGAGLVRLEKRPNRTIHIEAARTLPSNARLIIDSFVSGEP